MAHLWHEEVVTFFFHLDAHTAECAGDDAQILDRRILDTDALSHHSGHSNERSHLNHIWQDSVYCAVEAFYTLDGQQIGCYARDAGSHPVEHLAELLEIRLAGSIINSGGALCQDGGHHDIGSSGDGGLVKQHILSFQLLGRYFIDITFWHGIEVRPQAFKAQEVGVQPAASYLVASWLGNHGFTHTGQHGPDHHHRSAQLGTLLHELIALHIIQIQVVSQKGVGIVFVRDLYAYILEQLDQVHHIADMRNVVYGDRLTGQYGSTDHLQGLVLGALWLDGSAQRMSPFDDECCHYLRFFPLVRFGWESPF